MTLRDLADANKEGKVSFGIREVLKLAKKKKIKKDARIFVAKDAREDTFKKLEEAGVEFEVLKTKTDISHELGIDFDSEVFLIN
jgi:ribosomal protein L7Ae-like RNA K-turn-binding protein